MLPSLEVPATSYLESIIVCLSEVRHSQGVAKGDEARGPASVLFIVSNAEEAITYLPLQADLRLGMIFSRYVRSQDTLERTLASNGTWMCKRMNVAITWPWGFE